MASPRTHGDNNSDDLLWGIVAIAGGLLIAWLIFHAQIAYLVMKLRALEWHLMVFDSEGRAMLSQWIQSTHPSVATFQQLVDSGSVAGYTLRWPVLLWVLGLYGWLWKRDQVRSQSYCSKHSIESLTRQEQTIWPATIPALQQDLTKVSLDHPTEGMRKAPIPYCRKLGLLVRNADVAPKHRQHYVTLDDGWALNRTKTERIFSAQLGEQWRGLEHCKTHEKALIAACLAQAHFDNTLAQAILADLNRAWPRAMRNKDLSQINTPRVQTALHKYGKAICNDGIRDLCTEPYLSHFAGRHAFKRTFMIAMLRQARENGVMPTAWFRWLKSVDRLTWYCLNDLGLDHNASTEAAGPAAHFMAEQKAGLAIPKPIVSHALPGLIRYLNSYIIEE